MGWPSDSIVTISVDHVSPGKMSLSKSSILNIGSSSPSTVTWTRTTSTTKDDLLSNATLHSQTLGLRPSSTSTALRILHCASRTSKRAPDTAASLAQRAIRFPWGIDSASSSLNVPSNSILWESPGAKSSSEAQESTPPSISHPSEDVISIPLGMGRSRITCLIECSETFVIEIWTVKGTSPTETGIDMDSGGASVPTMSRSLMSNTLERSASYVTSWTSPGSIVRM